MKRYWKTTLKYIWNPLNWKMSFWWQAKAYWMEGWENGATAAFRKLVDDGKITKKEEMEYIRKWWL